MTESVVDVVQFVHPGFEYHRREHVGSKRIAAGVMDWKPGNSQHDRKFMVTWGSVMERRTGQIRSSVPLTFWGEWEGPSVFWKVESPGKPFPTVIHAPFRPSSPPAHPVQNTDPMVFGDAFVYSNCLQRAFRILRQLKPGSIVLFGRHGRSKGDPAFGLDTCLVVDRAESLKPAPFDSAGYGRDLLADAVAAPLYSEGAKGEFVAYYGRTPNNGSSVPFSFFPARSMRDGSALFPRPQLQPINALHRVISSEKTQGIKVTSDLTAEERDAIWREVATQVAGQGCELGYHASPPPVLEPFEAELAIDGELAPLEI